MKNLAYKGYTGSIEYSEEDQLLFGRVSGIKSLISYEGSTEAEIEQDFREAVHDYVTDCKVLQIGLEEPFREI